MGRSRQHWVLVSGILLASCTPSARSPLPASPSTASTLVPPPEDSPAVTQASEPVTPDANGNYGRTDHRTWQVVDPDPNGLNCRWHAAMPADWYAPDTQFPNREFGQWQVVRQFSSGSILTANLAPAGFATLYDQQQQPWLKVEIGENDTICLVRANAAYIQPIAR